VSQLAACLLLFFGFLLSGSLSPVNEFPTAIRGFDARYNKVFAFTAHAEYRNLSHEFDSLWEDLITPNGGFLSQKDGGDEANHYGISMFHQLHCLAIIRSALQQATSGKMPAGNMKMGSHNEIRVTQYHSWGGTATKSIASTTCARYEELHSNPSPPLPGHLM
jgi:hypothetical protein